jgi:hypothetical protein
MNLGEFIKMCSDFDIKISKMVRIILVAYSIL